MPAVSVPILSYVAFRWAYAAGTRKRNNKIAVIEKVGNIVQNRFISKVYADFICRVIKRDENICKSNYLISIMQLLIEINFLFVGSYVYMKKN